MKPFTYERVTDPRTAGEAVSRAGAKFISGGTNLLDLMKLEIEQPAHLVDISPVAFEAGGGFAGRRHPDRSARQTPKLPPIIACARATPFWRRHCLHRDARFRYGCRDVGVGGAD